MSDATNLGSPLREIAAYDGRRQPGVFATDTPQLSLIAFLASVFRRRAILLVFTLASLSVAAVYLRFAVPQFSSTALVLIDQRSNQPLRLAPALTDAVSEASNIESQVEIIKSEHIMQLAVADLKLAGDPALAPNSFVRAMQALRQSLPPWMRSGSAFQVENGASIRAASALQKRVYIHRVGTTFLIQIDATMPSAAQAAAVANSLTRVYIADQQSRREDLTRRQSELLQARSRELEHDVQGAEQAVEQLKFSGSLSDENSVAAQVKLKDLQSLAHTYRLLHDKFLEQSAESWQQQFLAIPDATTVSPAYPPLEKSSPQSLIIMALSLLLGLSLGSMAIVLIDRKALGLAR